MDTQQIIAALRQEFGLSQTEIASRVKVPQPRISRWENGEVPTAADDALALARLLDDLRGTAEKGASGTDQAVA
ncbi:hypothetical protein METUNv1_01709 [Methyloversatilis universalis FAM5]|uniref:HTH cro/C1-type domain-containing protein n=1 Tax=Methyloversatilis universalis (strain ATCC BAA-1314 / DSM 25237 / JCM 13912 / CCUG 52030 / FAM5) TaxID=1000565 RepID=F5RBR4_METUF|nr:helix-turn-helix transcriptional regulator [Methyloversatilis universalis]EGK71931.1 hypothetical protein METUNv1_01709 [Methyloversatilis universalis FAM5]